MFNDTFERRPHGRLATARGSVISVGREFIAFARDGLTVPIRGTCGLILQKLYLSANWMTRAGLAVSIALPKPGLPSTRTGNP